MTRKLIDGRCNYVGMKPVYDGKEEWFNFVQNIELFCKLKPDTGKYYCPRHELLIAQNIEQPDRWECDDCGKKYKVEPQHCAECGDDLLHELPVNIPI